MEAILSSSNGLSLVALTPTYVADEEGLPWWLSVKESACQCRGEGNGTPLQYSCLENPMDGGAW